MLDPVINSIATVIGWIRGTFSSIADVFNTISYYAGQIPFVGKYLAPPFIGIASFFDTVSANVYNFGYYLKNGLNAIDDWLDKLATLWSAVWGWILDKLDDAYIWAGQALDDIVALAGDVADVFAAIPTFSEIFTWLMNHLGIYKKSGESWIQAIARTINAFLPDWDIPTFNEIFAWLMSFLGVYKQSDESWIQAITRKIAETLAAVHIPGLGDMIVEVFGIQKQSGESSWDAIIRTIITSIPGLAGIVNFWSLWWSSLNDFFNDPWGWLVDKFTDWFLGPEK